MGKIGKRSAWRWLGRYGRDRRGNVSTMVAILIVPLVGVMGIATETGNWLSVQRSAQNAADSAVIAAATNASATQPLANQTYVTEGRSVAANFGFTNGVNNTTVTVTYPDNSVPAKCASKCYAVTVSRTLPVYLNRVIGWSSTQTVTAKSVAIAQVVPTSYCLISLGTTGVGFQINGGNSVDLHGCNVLSNGDTTCNGTNSNGGANSITYGPSGSNKKCSPSVQETSVFADPYSSLASNIPANSCSSYPGATVSGSVTWGAVQHYCGTVSVSSATITTPSTGTLLIIENGDLNIATQLLTAAGSGLTVLLTGTNAGSHVLSGSGDMNIAAPPAGSGTWSGIAVYQNPALTSGVDMSSAGNAPTWDISGVIYVPNSNLQFKGVVNKANNGLDCFILVDFSFQSKGTGDILENQSQCAAYGITPPSGGTTIRTALVL